MNPEIHLFVIWHNAGAKEEQVIDRIDRRFTILAKYRIQWSTSLFTSNLSRFYGQKLPAGHTKAQSCGRGPFTLVIVRDENPVYEIRETLQGAARVNVRCFDLKNHFRTAEAGGLPIHATNSEQETRRDLMLLLGQHVDQYATASDPMAKSAVQPMQQDLPGARGWKSIDELFTVLNASIAYVVMRNFDGLPADYLLDGHGDIDLLVEDFGEAILLANAQLVYTEANSVHAHVVIEGERVPFDFRYVGDGYFDTTWQRRILETRVQMRGFFVPNAVEHFYTLLYHAAVHKAEISSDYAARLRALSGDLAIIEFSKVDLADPANVRRFLKQYMDRFGNRFVKPMDDSVIFNKAVAVGPLRRLIGSVMRRGDSVPPYDRWVRATGEATDVGDTQDATVSLLMPLGLIEGKRVLQVGCGSGGVSQFLTSSARAIVIVENDPVLAADAQAAYAGHQHVEVINTDILDYQAIEPFDVITMLNGLSEDPVSAMTSDGYLQAVAGHLNERGILMLGVENAYGLAAWNSGKVGRCQSGAVAVANPDGKRSEAPPLNHRQWLETLRATGLESVDSYFLFPDLHDTRVILSEAGLFDDRLNVADLLFRQYRLEVGEHSYRLFAENLVLRDLVQQGSLPMFANAYLFVAQRDGHRQKPPNWLAAFYNRGMRKACYQIETRIRADDSGGLVVEKERLWPDVSADSSWLQHEVSDSAYLKGELLVTRVHAAMAAESAMDELLEAFAPWVKFLLSQAERKPSGDWLLPGDFIDCVPDNFLLHADGDVSYFDREWRSDEDVPFAWVFVRGVIYSLKGAMENRRLQTLSYRDFLLEMAAYFELPLSGESLVQAGEYEARFAASCYPDSVSVPDIRDYLDEPIDAVFRLGDQVPALKNALRWHEMELARVKQTFSWRITAPLRVVWNLFQKIAPGTK